MLQVGLEIEEPKVTSDGAGMPSLPKPLTLEEKKYLLAVERGDIANVRRLGSYCIVYGNMRDRML
jgi:transient-receptor-potential-like protein